MKSLFCFAAACGVVASIAGCGQKGALYLPDHNGTVITRPAGASAPGTPPPAPQSTPAGQAPASQPATGQAPTAPAPAGTTPGQPPDKNSNDNSQPPK